MNYDLARESEVRIVTRYPGSEGVRFTDRIGDFDTVEKSVRDARSALSAAEEALKSVHAGLALEPMEMAPVPDAVVEAVAEKPVVQATALDGLRRSMSDGAARGVARAAAAWSRLQAQTALLHLPVGMQVVGLVVFGWFLAVAVVFPAVGTEKIAAWSAGLKAGMAAVIGAGPSPRSADAAVVAANSQIATARESSAVVIYERTSPYPTFFKGIAAKDRLCLSEAIYFEARGEPIAGQIAVAQVVLNRTLAGPWPKTICGVTLQGVENGEKCQFSYACMRTLLARPSGEAWDNARGLADEILEGGAWLEEMLDATHFHRTDLKPVWRLALVEVGRFGRHVFYSSPTENRRPLSRVAVGQ